MPRRPTAIEASPILNSACSSITKSSSAWMQRCSGEAAAVDERCHLFHANTTSGSAAASDESRGKNAKEASSPQEVGEKSPVPLPNLGRRDSVAMTDIQLCTSMEMTPMTEWLIAFSHCFGADLQSFSTSLDHTKMLMSNRFTECCFEGETERLIGGDTPALFDFHPTQERSKSI